MKKPVSLLICLLMISQCVMFVSATEFRDVPPAAYFYEAVEWAVEKGITAGKTDTTFAPNESCTRAQAVSFMYRAEGKPITDGTIQKFTDVKPSDYFAVPVQWAFEKGITAGVSDTRFGPHKDCTRGQIVSFIYRCAGSPAVDDIANPFKDVKESDYFYNAVLWAVKNNITAGMSADKFAPNAKCTRGQIVCFLERYYNVPDALEIVTQPLDYQMTSSSEDAFFTVEIKGGKGDYRYEWYVNDVKKATEESTPAKKLTYTISVTDYDFDMLGDINVYCVITDANGTQVKTDTVSVLPKEAAPTPLSIKTQPQKHQMTSSQEEVTFTVEISGGKPKYYYEWYVNDVKKVTHGATSARKDSCTFEITDYDFDVLNRIFVYCIITDIEGTEIKTDTVEILPKEELLKPFKIVTELKDHHMTSSQEQVTFTVEVEGGKTPYTYDWTVTFINDNGSEVLKDSVTAASPTSILTLTFTDYDFDYYDEITISCTITDGKGNKLVADTAHVYPKA